MAPSSRFASCRKPNVAYLVLNFCALWKKQTTLPSLAYAGIPYQSLDERAGALALMIAWSRSPMARSGCGISAIFASTALSPSALSARGPGRAAAFFAAFSVVPLAGFCGPFIAGFLSAIVSADLGESASTHVYETHHNGLVEHPRRIREAGQVRPRTVVAKPKSAIAARSQMSYISSPDRMSAGRA